MDEIQFQKAIIKIKALAKKQGDKISKEQVHEHFLPLNMEEGQFLFVFKYLTEENITLFDTEEDRMASDSEAAKDESELVTINSEDSEYLKMYLKELNEMKIADKDERQAILTEVLTDRDKAKELIPNLYLREVVDVARLYAGQGVLIEDLIGEGNVGILVGIKMLDCCETTEEIEEFMMKVIMDSMESLIMERVSNDDFDMKVLERVNDLNEKAKELSEELLRKITIEELSKELNLEEDYIRETIKLSGDAISYIE